MMMLAVINGLKPTNTKEKLAKAPPDRRLRNPPKSVLPNAELMAWRNCVGSASGTGMCASNRYTTMIPTTIDRRFCISLFFNDRQMVFQLIIRVLSPLSFQYIEFSNQYTGVFG